MNQLLLISLGHKTLNSGYVLKLIKADLVTDLIWLLKVRSESISTPRFRTWSLVSKDSDSRCLLTATLFSLFPKNNDLSFFLI